MSSVNQITIRGVKMNKRLALAMIAGAGWIRPLVGGPDRPVCKRKKKKPTKNEIYHWSRIARREAGR